MTKKLHLVSFDVPYPTNYGGVIDVFYKLKALHKQNIEIYLHVFEYGKGEQLILNKYCKEVYYYKRNPYLSSIIDKKIPFIAKSRGNIELIENLKKTNAPILFDGLHTTFVLTQTNFPNQKIYVRVHNIEHEFYKGLYKSETNIFRKTFYKQEAKKLKEYEAILNKVDGIFSISPHEQAYFLKTYGEKAIYIPAFHKVPENNNLSKKGKIVFYHGNLLVSENTTAAKFLIDIYKKTEFNLVIASSFENKNILKLISNFKNIDFKKLETESDLIHLFQEAHINVLPTFQKTGIKLKLLNSLYQSRFIIANNFMIDDTGLETLVEKANTKKEFLEKTVHLFQQEFNAEIQQKRVAKLNEINPTTSAEKLVKSIFN